MLSHEGCLGYTSTSPLARECSQKCAKFTAKFLMKKIDAEFVGLARSNIHLGMVIWQQRRLGGGCGLYYLHLSSEPCTKVITGPNAIQVPEQVLPILARVLRRDKTHREARDGELYEKPRGRFNRSSKMLQLISTWTGHGPDDA